MRKIIIILLSIFVIVINLYAGEHDRIIFLHHSTGGNVYNYPDKGVPQWFQEYDDSNGTTYQISDSWYPASGNMPVHYYNVWIEENDLDSLVQNYDVIIWKHCFPGSDVDTNTGNPDPSSTYQSIENYQAVYRLIRNKMDIYPNKIFIIWTLPPRHRLYGPPNGDTLGNAQRALEFTNWVKNEYTYENGEHSNIYIWDFRDIVADSNGIFLRYEYERDHTSDDSHPNNMANNVAGPLFAQFIVDVIHDFETGIAEFPKRCPSFNSCSVYRGIKEITFNSLSNRDIIKIYDISSKLINNSGNIKDKIYKWNVGNVPSGVYFYRVEGQMEAKGKIIIIK